MKYTSQQDLNPLEYWRVLTRHKALIGTIVGVCFVTAVVVSLLLPKIYISTASIIPLQQEDSSGRLIKSISDRWVGIMKSRAIKDAVVKRHGLTEVFEVKTIEAASVVLGEMVSVKGSMEGIISIMVESKDPQRAADLANAFVEELDKFNKELGLQPGKRKIVFAGERLDETRRELQKAEEAVKAFRDKNSSTDLDDKTRGVISAIGGIRGQIMANEVELKILSSYGPFSRPQVAVLMTRLEWLYSRLNEFGRLNELKGLLGVGTPLPEGTFDYENIFIPTENTPDLFVQYARLLIDAKTQETFYELLTQQYEMASTQEAMDAPTMQMLDVARVPGRASKPRKVLIVELATIAAVFFALFMVFFLEYIEDLRAREAWQNEKKKAEAGEKRISGV